MRELVGDKNEIEGEEEHAQRRGELPTGEHRCEIDAENRAKQEKCQGHEVVGVDREILLVNETAQGPGDAEA